MDNKHPNIEKEHEKIEPDKFAESIEKTKQQVDKLQTDAFIRAEQKTVQQLADPYKQIALSYSNIDKGKEFVAGFLEKHGDTPISEIGNNNAKPKEENDAESLLNLTSFLPLGDKSISEYAQKIQKIIDVNLKGEQYQFAYLATHLLFMTYMYSVVWRTSRLYNSRYIDTLTFLKGYGEEGISFRNVNSIFDYHKIHEGDTFEFLKIIDVDKGYIINLKNLIKTRNGMAHANGGFEITTKEQYDNANNNILGIVEEINRKFESHIKEWYQNKLLTYMKANEEKIDEFIDNLINTENLSIKELEMCTKYGLAKIKNRRHYPDFTPEQINSVEKLHKEVKEKYKSLAGE